MSGIGTKPALKPANSITVLMYHRIDAVHTDPWGIRVTPSLFEAQLKYLTSRYQVISVAEAVQQLITGNIREHSICITFDDGYADNYTYAKPILEKYHCPATFFIPTAFIGAATPFWWDELEYILLHFPRLPPQLALTINEQKYQYTLQDTSLTSSQWAQQLNWKWYDDLPTDRCSVFLAVWQSLRPLPEATIQQHLSTLKNLAGISLPAAFRLPMNKTQIKTLFSNSLFTAGLHTHTHPDLGVKEKKVQLEEIEKCKSILSSEFNINSPYLAYPYGRYNQATLEVVKELQLAACFTTEAVAVGANADLTTLGRHQVGNRTLAEFKNTLAI